jgi:hypothetical protein
VRRPKPDPRVTDLRRYRRERERARRARPPKPAGQEPLLGRRRYAGLILLAALLILVVMNLLGHRL